MTVRSFGVERRALSWQSAVACACCMLSLWAGRAADAQLIPIKTVPVAQGDQLGFLPSATLGMAGVSIALADTLRDPFVNPAKGARLAGSQFFGSPSFYSVSANGGGGRTLPIGAMAKSRSTFAAVTLALQEISPGGPTPAPFVAADVILAPGPGFPAPPPRPQPRTNRYAFAMLGHSFPSRLSFAGSVLWSGLRAMEGVDLLYPRSQGIRQTGQALDFRVGMLKEWAGDRSLEAIVLHNRFGMTHDVSYVDFFWDPGTRTVVPQSRVEHNADRTNTYGLHVEYERPLADSGWRIGGLVTANRMAHPKIPNYEIMNIPRDPGYSSAYNLGIGVSQSKGPSSFGLDVILEPIWSHTWADAESDVATDAGGTIPAGGKTIENRFQFVNALVRAGVSREFELDTPESSIRLQLGVQMRSIYYWLDQHDHVRDRGRALEESWIEWTRSWGLSLRFSDLDIHYRRRSTTGTGLPGVAGTGGPRIGTLDAAGASVLIAPSGPLSLQPASVTTHQFSISVPIR